MGRRMLLGLREHCSGPHVIARCAVAFSGLEAHPRGRLSGLGRWVIQFARWACWAPQFIGIAGFSSA
eukprot:342338-Alexandrium_andersonii.AAC.1